MCISFVSTITALNHTYSLVVWNIGSGEGVYKATWMLYIIV